MLTMNSVSRVRVKGIFGVLGIFILCLVVVVAGYFEHLMIFFTNGLLVGLFVFIFLFAYERIFPKVPSNRANIVMISAYGLLLAIVGGAFYLTTPPSYMPSLSLFTSSGKLIISLFLVSAILLPATGWTLIRLVRK